MNVSHDAILYVDDWGHVSYRTSDSTLREPASWIVIRTSVITEMNLESLGLTEVDAYVESNIPTSGLSASSLDFTYRVHTYLEE